MISFICVICAISAIIIFCALIYIGLSGQGNPSARQQIIQLVFSRRIYPILAVIISVVLAFILGFIMAKSLSRRIRRVSEHVERLSAGDFDSRVENVRDGELGMLAQRTNELGSRLQTMKMNAFREKSKSEVLLERMASGVVVTDREGRVVLVNPSATEMLGISEETVIGSLSYDVLIGRFAQAPSLQELNKGCEAGGGVFEITSNNRIIEVRYNMLRPDSGFPFRCLMMLVDRTEAASLDEKQSDFVANVSHELKTPLTIIKTHSETLLESDIEDKEVEKRMLRRIDEEADHMRDIVRDLLTLARLENNQEAIIYKRMKLKPFIDNLVLRARERGDAKGVAVELEYNADPELIINGDKTRLEQAFLNVTGNSLNYTDQGGKVSFTVDTEGSGVRICIADTGIGISSEDLSRVFERFFRVDKARSRAAGGTGLGLPIAKEYVEAHGGNISIESELGKGTTVTITLPAAVDSGEIDGEGLF